MALRPWLWRGLAALSLLLAACAEVHTSGDAGTAADLGGALDLGSAADADAPDVGLHDVGLQDAPRLDAMDAATPADARPRPIDAPFVPIDAMHADVPFVPLDAGGCVPGQYALENTPIPFEPVALRYASTSGWDELWRAPSGAWVIHHVADDLESITEVGTLEGTPLVIDGFEYLPEPTDGVDVATGATLVVWRPLATRIDHVLVTVYGLDGRRRTAPVRVDVPDAARVDAAWTGTGYSLLLLYSESRFVFGQETGGVRVELDSQGAVLDRRPLNMGSLFPILVTLGYGPDRSWSSFANTGGLFGGLVSIAPDGALTIARTTGTSESLLSGSHAGGRHWIVSASFVVPGPPRLSEIDATGAMRNTVTLPDLSVIELAPEGDGVVAVLGRDAERDWFVRVGPSGVLQRLALPAAPYGPRLLRYLGGRYAVGWGGAFLDELRRCP